MAAKIPYLLLAAYGLLALLLDSVGLWKSGMDPFGVFETIGGAAMVGIAALGLIGRVSPRWLWSGVTIFVVVDVGWRLLS